MKVPGGSLTVRSLQRRSANIAPRDEVTLGREAESLRADPACGVKYSKVSRAAERTFDQCSNRRRLPFYQSSPI